jgi:hypothetical protein
MATKKIWVSEKDIKVIRVDMTVEFHVDGSMKDCQEDIENMINQAQNGGDVTHCTQKYQMEV